MFMKTKVKCIGLTTYVIDRNFDLIGTIIEKGFTVGKIYNCRVKKNKVFKYTEYFIENDYGNIESFRNHIYPNFDLKFEIL